MDNSEKPRVQIVQAGKRTSNQPGGQQLLKITSESEIPENCKYKNETNTTTDPSENEDSAALLIERATNCLQAMDLLGSMMAKECYNLSKGGSKANDPKIHPSNYSAKIDRTFENIDSKSSEMIQVQKQGNNTHRNAVQISNKNKGKTRRIPVQVDSYYEKSKQSLTVESNQAPDRYTASPSTTNSAGSYPIHRSSETGNPSTGNPSISKCSNARHEVPSIGAMISSAKLRERKIFFSATLNGDVSGNSADSDVTPPTEPITTAREADDVDDFMPNSLYASEFDPETENFPDEKHYDEDGSTETNVENESPERISKQTENGQPSGASPIEHLTAKKLASLCLSQSEPRSLDFQYNKSCSNLSSSRANPFTRTHSDPLSTSAPYLHRESKLTYDDSASFPSVENMENFEDQSILQLSDVNSVIDELRTIGNQYIVTVPPMPTDDFLSSANPAQFSISCVSAVTPEQKPEETIFCETVQSNSFSRSREAKQAINHFNQSDFDIKSVCAITNSTGTTQCVPSPHNVGIMCSNPENFGLIESLSDNQNNINNFDETQCQMSHKTGPEAPALLVSCLDANLGSDSVENEQYTEEIYFENMHKNQITSKSKIMHQNIDQFNAESSSIEANLKLGKFISKSKSNIFASRNNQEGSVNENGAESISKMSHNCVPFAGDQTDSLKSSSCSSMECTHLAEDTYINSVTITSENFHYPSQVSSCIIDKPGGVKRNLIDNITDTEIASPAKNYFAGIVSVQSSEISSVTQISDVIPSDDGSIQSITCTLSRDQDRWSNDNQSISARISQPIIAFLGSVFDMHSKHDSQPRNNDNPKNSDTIETEYCDDTASIWLQNSNCDKEDIGSDEWPILEPSEKQIVSDLSHVINENDVDSFWVIDGVIQASEVDFSRGDESRNKNQLESDIQEDSKSDDALTRTLVTGNSVDFATGKEMSPDENRKEEHTSKATVLAPISVPVITERGFWIVFKESVIY